MEATLVDTHLQQDVYVSRKLSDSENKNDATVEKECLAFVWDVKKYFKYITGC